MVAILGVATSACGPRSTMPGNCTDDPPPTCPDPAPTYAAQVAPLMHQRCGSCHTPGGTGDPHFFDSYQQVHDQHISIQAQLSQCLMPPADQPQLTVEERQTIFGWIVCGSPND